MTILGYLVSDDADLDGKALFKPEFVAASWVEQIDLIDDWIVQLQIMKNEEGTHGKP